jgi:organic radical activating enzyme
MNPVFPSICLCVTLRCNALCSNCIEFCNMKEFTGLDYSDSDITLGQIENFIDQLSSFSKPVFDNLSVTGGEALLHPDISVIMEKMERIKQEGYINKVQLDSNLITDAPSNLQKYIYNDQKMKDKPSLHKSIFVHPLDFGGNRKRRYATCTHKRKRTVVLTYQGYSLCCAGDAYIRLFCMENLILDYLPKSIGGFPIGEMTALCRNCPFGSFFDSPHGEESLTISEIYAKEMAKNKMGRKILKRFPEI